MTPYQRPLPVPDEETANFWEGARRHELVIPRCGDCGFYIHYPKQRCPHCHSENVSGAVVSGRGTVYSFSIVHVRLAPGFDPPYPVALVEIEEQPGLWLVTNIVGCPLDAFHIGMPVRVVFQDVTPEVTLPLFTPVDATPGQTP